MLQSAPEKPLRFERNMFKDKDTGEEYVAYHPTSKVKGSILIPREFAEENTRSRFYEPYHSFTIKKSEDPFYATLGV